MHRRNFLTMTLGTAAAAMLPLPAMAAPAQAARPLTYAWAVAMAHAQARVSEGALVSQLGITPETARAVMARMLERGVIAAPDASGVAQAIAPMLRGVALPGMQAVASVTQAANVPGTPRVADVLRRAGDMLADEGATEEAKADHETLPL
jgi:hypothetical protein